jgi:hypothetical protein
VRREPFDGLLNRRAMIEGLPNSPGRLVKQEQSRFRPRYHEKATGEFEDVVAAQRFEHASGPRLELAEHDRALGGERIDLWGGNPLLLEDLAGVLAVDGGAGADAAGGAGELDRQAERLDPISAFDLEVERDAPLVVVDHHRGGGLAVDGRHAAPGVVTAQHRHQRRQAAANRGWKMSICLSAEHRRYKSAAVCP